MTQKNVGRCRLVLILLLCLLVEGAVITSSPQSATVLLTLNEERVNFTCEGIGDVLRWTVAGLTPTNPLNKERGVAVTDISTATGNLSSVLTIAILPINDGVVIACRLYSNSNPFDPAESACTLTIRGISPVEDIQWFTETQTLSWSRPSFYSQDLAEYAFADTNYNVLVDGTSIINTTGTSVELTSSLVNVSCTNFNVSITASAYVYVSEEKQEVIDNTGNYSVSILNVTVSYDEVIGCFNGYLANSVNRSGQSCNNTIIGKLTPDEGIVQDKQYIITDEREEIFPYAFIGLKPCQTYIAEIDILNFLNEVEAHDTTTIVAYQVQDVLVSSEGYTNRSVNVQCVFVSGSTADGCHVIFTDTTNGRNESFNIIGSDNTIISLSTGGYYTITVYDIFNGNIIPQLCVQPKGVTVHVVSSQSMIKNTHSVSEILLFTTLLSSTNIDNYYGVLTTTNSLPTAVTTAGNSTTEVLVISSVVATFCVAIVLTLTVAIWCIVMKKRKTTEGTTIADNPAYGQIITGQTARQVRASSNPAYETIALYNTANYEPCYEIIV